MGFPDIPLKVYEHLSFDCVAFIHGDWLYFKHSVVIFDFIIVTEKSVVIFLGIEFNNSCFGEFSHFNWEDFDAF